MPGSVADIAGLRVGEQLVTISGTVLRASNHKQLMSILKQTRKQRRAITVGLAASSDRPPSVGGAINTPGGTSLAHNSGLTGRTGSGGSGANGERAPQIFLPPGSMGASTHGRSAWHDTPNNVEFGTLDVAWAQSLAQLCASVRPSRGAQPFSASPAWRSPQRHAQPPAPTV